MDTMETPDIKDVILVTHKGCMDGAGCALMFLMAGGKRSNIHYVPAGMVERFIKEDLPGLGERHIIFADIGINRPEYADVLEKRGNLVYLDHHTTSEHMRGRKWAGIDMDGCGTELLRRHLVEMYSMLDLRTYREFAAIIDDHDRGIFEKPVSSDLAMYMSFLGQQEFIDRFLAKLRMWAMIGGINYLFNDSEIDLLRILKRRRDDAVDAALRRVVKRELNKPEYFPVPVTIAYVVTSEQNVTFLLNAVMDSNPDCPIVAQVDIEKGTVSFRSRGDFDVAKLAKLFDGGGHRRAAGHRIKFLSTALEEILDIVHG